MQVLGSQYIWGNISLYCASYYYHNASHKDMSNPEGVLALGVPIIVISSTIMMPMSPWLIETWKAGWCGISSEKMVMLMALTILTVGTAIAALLPGSMGNTSLLIFTILYSMSFGICNGLAYTVPLRVAWAHFPNQKGTISGIIIGGFGLGSFIFGFVSTQLINPEKKRATVTLGRTKLYEESVAQHMPTALLIMIAIWFSIGLAAIGLMRVKQQTPMKEL